MLSGDMWKHHYDLENVLPEERSSDIFYEISVLGRQRQIFRRSKQKNSHGIFFFLAAFCTENPKGLLQQHHSCCSSLFYSQLKVSCCSVISVMAHDFHQLVLLLPVKTASAEEFLHITFLCQSHGP